MSNKKDCWERNVSAFCERGNIHPDSRRASALYALSDEKFQEITAVMDPSVDALIDVDTEGFTINFGNVGSIGIRYDF